MRKWKMMVMKLKNRMKWKMIIYDAVINIKRIKFSLNFLTKFKVMQLLNLFVIK